MASKAERFDFRDINGKLNFSCYTSFVYQLEDTDVVLEQGDPLSKRKRRIRGKLISCKEVALPGSKIVTKDIVLYVHGGMFVSCSSATHAAFLCELCRQIGTKVAFLALDYRLSLKHRFPAALQDVLDCCLWLKNSKGEDIAKVLGFKVAF